MRGTMLAAIAVAIMSATGYRFKLKGIYWRAGLLTAAMKTLSPSAVLLAPMIAIVMQGLIMELVITAGGPRRISFVIGGALSITWNFVHLILGYWMYYGNDVIALYDNLVAYARKETGWSFVSGTTLIVAFGSVYFINGAIAGWLGTAMRKPGIAKPLNIPRKENPVGLPVKKAIANLPDRSIFWLFLLPFMVASQLYMMIYLPLEVCVFAWTAAIAMLIIRYRSSYKRLAKIRFWIIFLFLTVLSSLLLGPTLQEGLLIGLRMNMRAILFVLVLAALSFELRNEKLTHQVNMRMKHFLAVVETSFDTLPMVISILPPAATIIKKPRESLSLFAGTFSVWVDSMHFRQLDPMPIVLITGEKGSGKSQLIEEKVLPYLPEKQIDFSGIVMNYVFADEKHVGYKIRLLPGNDEKILVGPDVADAQLTIGRYAFSDSAFDAGTKHTIDLLPKSKLVVLDECGWLESYGLGWYALMKEIRTQSIPLIVVVRPNLSSDFCRFWNVKPVKELVPNSLSEDVKVAVDLLMC